MADDALTRAFAVAEALRTKAHVNPIFAPPTGLGRDSYKPNLEREAILQFRDWVYAAVRPIAQRVAGQAVCVGRKKAQRKIRQTRAVDMRRAPAFVRSQVKEADGLEVVESHEILDVLANPNPFHTGFDLMNLTVETLELAGEMYWWLNETPEGLEIWPLPPSWVRPEHEEGQLFKNYKVWPLGAGLEVDVPPEEMVRFFYPDPQDPILGCLSPLVAGMRAVLSDSALQESQRRAFVNGINPGLALIVGRHPDVPGIPGQRPHLSETQRKVLVTAIKQRYQGVANADEPLILDGLIEDVKKINNTPKEMDYLASSGLTKARIFQVFGTNPIIAGEITGVNYATAAAASELFNENTVNPKIERLSQALTKLIAWRFGDDLVMVDRAGPRPRSRREAGRPPADDRGPRPEGERAATRPRLPAPRRARGRGAGERVGRRWRPRRPVLSSTRPLTGSTGTARRSGTSPTPLWPSSAIRPTSWRTRSSIRAAPSRSATGGTPAFSKCSRRPWSARPSSGPTRSWSPSPTSAE